MKCDCKAFPHDDWCDRHPNNVVIAEQADRIADLEHEVETLKVEIECGAVHSNWRRKAEERDELKAEVERLTAMKDIFHDAAKAVKRVDEERIDSLRAQLSEAQEKLKVAEEGFFAILNPEQSRGFYMTVEWATEIAIEALARLRGEKEGKHE